MQTRRRLWAAALVTVLCMAGLIWRAVTWEPAFYRPAIQATGSSQRVRELSRSLVQGAMQLVDEVRNEPAFAAEFSEDEINAWLADELERKFQKWLPQGISQPRIHLEQDRLMIACKVRRGALAGVASTEVGVWVTEDHRLALSIDALRAGLIPLPASDMFEPVVRRLQRDGQHIEWGNSQGKDVLVLDLFSESGDRQAEDQPVRQLDSVEVLPGKLRVRGRQVDQPAVR